MRKINSNNNVTFIVLSIVSLAFIAVAYKLKLRNNRDDAYLDGYIDGCDDGYHFGCSENLNEAQTAAYKKGYFDGYHKKSDDARS